MEFELLLAWTSCLNLFPRFSLTFRDRPSNPFQEGYSFGWHCVNQRLEQHQWSLLFPPSLPLTWQLLKYRIQSLYWDRAGWSIYISIISICLQAFCCMADCLHKAQTGSLCNWTLLWNGAVRPFCEIGSWFPFTKCCSAAPSEVLLDKVYCNLGKISMIGSGKKKGNYSF